MTICRQTGLLVFMPAAFLLLCPSSAKATDRYWNAASGDWSDTDPCPWSLGTEPTASDNAYINNGGTASVTQSAEWCSSLYLGGDDTGGIEMIDGTLSTSFSAFIGYTGTGTFTQTGGTNSISSYLYLGSSSGSSGTYDLSGTGQLSATAEYIGYSGTGTFTQTGGTNSISTLFLGNSSGSGTYNLSGSGQLSANTEYIGYSGTGTRTFTQTDGTNFITENLYLGYYSGSSGTYNLSGSGQLTASTEYIGYSGTGTFTQTGGTNSISTLVLGNISGSSGSYELSGTGQLSANTEYIGNLGTATKTFTQTGGTNTISSTLYLGYNPGSSGSYELSGTGQLSAGYEYIGRSGTGTFTQTGGTNSISSTLYLGYNSGSSGSYELSSTGQLSAVFEYIGRSGTGTFEQTGGINTATYIQINTNGTYTLTGGTLNINGGFVNQGILDLSNSSMVINVSSSIVNLSGTILATTGNATLNIDAHSLLIVPSGHDPAEYFASINNAGCLVHQAGSTLDISSAYSIYGTGSIEDHVNCQGTLSATSGYTIKLNGGLNILDAGCVNLRDGKLYVNDAISGISGGSLNAAYQYIGSTGTGTFTQTGGTNSITFDSNSELTPTLYLGYNSGASGTYNLTGGTLILKSLIKGSGTAAFNFGGGTLQASGNFNTTLPMTLTGINGNANIDTAGYTVGLSGVLSGIGGFNKLGTGTLSLNTLNTYSGDTTVNGGTLEIAGGIDPTGTSLIDIQSGKAVFKTVNVNKTNLNINTATLATFEVLNGSHEVGMIDGTGITQVDAGANLTTTFIHQDTLTIGAGGKVTLYPITVSHTWDGDGADDLWTTKENWFGNVAPSPSDNLVFPAGAERLENFNNFAPGTLFGTITVSGNGYNIQGNTLQSSIIEVKPNTNFQVNAINVNTLSIASGGKVILGPITGGPLSGTITPVPEPSTLVLLIGAFFLLALAWARKDP